MINPPQTAIRKLGKRPSPTVRWQIVGWVMLTATIAIATILFSIYQILRHDVIEKANLEIEQELGEFRNFVHEGHNPETSESFESSEELLKLYISRQYAGYTEQQIGIAGGNIFFLKEEEDHALEAGYRLHQDQETLQKISSNSETSGIEQTPLGPIHWGRVDILLNENDQQTSGQLIIVEYIQPAMENVNRTLQIMLGVAILALFLALLISWLVAGRILKPIRDLRKVAEVVSDKNFTGRVPVTGKDDISAMSLNFNQMLDRLEESATIQRQFLDDVSHELRTPITIVRGHLELMERTTAEQNSTLALVDDELDRMGRIVADLLLLAKSERPDFITRRPCDIAELMINLDSKIQAFSGNRWVISEIADGEVLLDQQRITQALIQLCANANQYSPAGSIVDLGSNFSQTQEVKMLNFWVRDRGQGISDEDATNIFNRFQRLTAKNPATALEHSQGAGLGLAIVKTIAEGHQGSVWVAQPDQGPGSIFGISIPLDSPEQETEVIS